MAILRSLLMVSILFAACSEEPAAPDPGNQPGGISIVSGDKQDLRAGEQSVQSLRVVVTGSNGLPVSGVTVTWRTTDGAVANPATTLTDGNGVATTYVTAGLMDGSVEIEASVEGFPLTASFTARVRRVIQSLGITAPLDTLRVGAKMTLTLTTRYNDGTSDSNLDDVIWKTNATHASVSKSGGVSASAIGVATITATRGTASASITLTLMPSYLVLQNINEPGLTLAPGDTFRVRTAFLDLYGAVLPSSAEVKWVSSNPGTVTVSSAGTVRATGTLGSAEIIASGLGVYRSAYVNVQPVAPGPTTVRLVHVSQDLGALTFVPNKGSDVSLTFGGTANLEINAGLLTVEMLGFPRGQYALLQNFSGLVDSDNPLTLYATGVATQGWLVPAWGKHAAVNPNQALVRVVWSNSDPRQSYTNDMYFAQPGAKVRGGTAVACYFDLGITDYMLRDAGPFDIVLISPGANITPDDPGVEWGRIRVEPRAGAATTYVVVGNSAETTRVLTFIDP